MNKKQLKSWIAAGVFSTAMLAGSLYAEDVKPAAESQPAPAKKSKKMRRKHHKKNAEAASEKPAMKQHACAGMNDCKGQGGCKGSDQGCKGKNTCKGKGGCGHG